MAVERGAAFVDVAGRYPAAIDLLPADGSAPRLGLYDVVSDVLRIDIAVAGAPRPTGLQNAATYSTPR